MAPQAPIGISFEDGPKKTRVYDVNHGKPVDLTPEAVMRVKSYTQGDERAKGKFFRIGVEGGGCSGLQYKFTFTGKEDGDVTVPCGDIEILIDKEALDYIKGAVVDYVDDPAGSGFVVENPQAKASCGCGTSFTV